MKNKNQKKFPCLEKYEDLYSFRMHFSSRTKRQPSNNFSLKSGNLLRVFKIRKLFGSKLLSVHLKFSFGNASQTLVVKVLQKIWLFGTVDKSCSRWNCYAGRPYKQFWRNHWKLFRSKISRDVYVYQKISSSSFESSRRKKFWGYHPNTFCSKSVKKKFFGFFRKILFAQKNFHGRLWEQFWQKWKKFFFKRQKINDVLGIVSGSCFSLCRVKCFEQHQPNIKYLVRTNTLDAYTRNFHETSERHSEQSSQKFKFIEKFLAQISFTRVQIDPRTPQIHLRPILRKVKFLKVSENVFSFEKLLRTLVNVTLAIPMTILPPRCRNRF